MAFTLVGGHAWWDRAGVRHNSWRGTKYYRFNGQVVAMRKNRVLSYLHGDHLGSTFATTNSSGNFSGQEWYHAYGRYRGGHELSTENRFTGQKLDGAGLMYFNARYYDPELGQFLSPDTLVPDATNLFDYNRYAYARLNPLRYNDPTGHCGIGSVGGPTLTADTCGGGAGAAAAAAIQLAVDGAGIVVGTATVVNAVQGHQESVPLPQQTKLDVSPIPLVDSLAGSHPSAAVPDVPSQQVLVEPLLQENRLTIYTYTSALDQNMQQAGIARPPGAAAHHIVAANDRRAGVARLILAGVGIGVNDAANGVYLPADPNTVNVGSAIHSQVHTNAYYDEVERRLLNPGQGGVVAELQRIGRELLNGTFPH